jgi:hypothetical protein
MAEIISKTIAIGSKQAGGQSGLSGNHEKSLNLPDFLSLPDFLLKHAICDRSL